MTEQVVSQGLRYEDAELWRISGGNWHGPENGSFHLLTLDVDKVHAAMQWAYDLLDLLNDTEHN